jgi:hypothetical protein
MELKQDNWLPDDLKSSEYPFCEAKKIFFGVCFAFDRNFPANEVDLKLESKIRILNEEFPSQIDYFSFFLLLFLYFFLIVNINGNDFDIEKRLKLSVLC